MYSLNLTAEDVSITKNLSNPILATPAPPTKYAEEYATELLFNSVYKYGDTKTISDRVKMMENV